MKSRPSQRQGFTLIELLVVIAIIAILAAILFPVLSRVRESARKSGCQSNLGQIYKALMAYQKDFDGYFPFHDHPVGPVLHGFEERLANYTTDMNVFVCPSHRPRPGYMSLAREHYWGYVAYPYSYALNHFLGDYLGEDSNFISKYGHKVEAGLPMKWPLFILVCDGEWTWVATGRYDDRWDPANWLPQPSVPDWTCNTIGWRHPRPSVVNGRIQPDGGANFLMGDGHEVWLPMAYPFGTPGHCGFEIPEYRER